MYKRILLYIPCAEPQASLWKGATKKPSSHLPTERASVQKPTDNLQSKGELFGVRQSLSAKDE